MVKSSAHCLWERAARLSGSHPSCLKPTAAAANSGSLLGSDPRKWHLFTAPHGVQSLLTSESTQHFSASRLTSYEIHLLSPVNLHLWPSRVLTLLCNQPRLTQVCPGCAVTTSSFVTLWSRFTSSFPNTDLILSVDTSSCRNEKKVFPITTLSSHVYPHVLRSLQIGYASQSQKDLTSSTHLYEIFRTTFSG